jgi:RNA-directed DNA polymerase
MIRRKKLS